MTMPVDVSPEQRMMDRADYARKGIARGRSVVVLSYDSGIAFVADNPRALHKISEIYDRIAFAAVGKYNEFENLRVAGVRYADLRGFSYDRADVTARGLANVYAQTLGSVFTTEPKPFEVELTIAEVGDSQSEDQIYRISYDGSVADVDGFVAMGGQAEQIQSALGERWREGLSLSEALVLAVELLAPEANGAPAAPGSSSASAPPAELGPGSLEVGSHPEYATPECDDVRQLVVHDRAGERILEGLMVDAERRLHEEGIAGEVFLFKNNTDSAGNSYGCHENYLVSRHGEFGRLSDVLIPFLVTRQLICGAGKVLQTPRGAVYCLSQRAEHIWEGVSSATTRSRPIINTRDEPHADAERYRRLHVIVGDSNMNECTTLLKVGSADLVLRMMEQGITFKDLTLENPIRAISEHSPHLTGTRQVRLAAGRSASALEIQREYYSRAVDFVASSGETPSTKRVIELWGRTLDAIEQQDLTPIDREIDW